MVLEKFIKQYIQSTPVPIISFAWQGGEQMLAGPKFYQTAIEYQKFYGAGRCIINTLQTNGPLINEDWSKFFKQHHFLTGISIDGAKEIHDHYRHDHHGANTWCQSNEGYQAVTDL